MLQAMRPHRTLKWAAFWLPTPYPAICPQRTRRVSLRSSVAARTGLKSSGRGKASIGRCRPGEDRRGEGGGRRQTRAADAARKTGVYVALWAFVSLLIGAFSASYMATVGGRIRDDLPISG